MEVVTVTFLYLCSKREAAVVFQAKSCPVMPSEARNIELSGVQILCAQYAFNRISPFVLTHVTWKNYADNPVPL